MFPLHFSDIRYFLPKLPTQTFNTHLFFKPKFQVSSCLMHEQAAAHVCTSAGTSVHVVEDTTQSPEIRADTGF